MGIATLNIEAGRETEQKHIDFATRIKAMKNDK